MSDFPNLGYGVGLRSPHFESVLRDRPAVDFFEIVSENFMQVRGYPRHVLERVAERYPIVMHGVSMSIGSADPLDFDYLRALKTLADETRARWVSDHLCWTGIGGTTSHDLLPLPLSEETLRHVAARVRTVQEFLERPLVLENPSSYYRFPSDSLDEADFLAALAHETDCRLLLDVNNVYVSSVNHAFDPYAYIAKIPADRVVQFHLAGHTNKGTHILDTHDDHVIDAVWDLYRFAVAHTGGGVSTLIEWDAKIPPFDVLHAEALRARDVAEERAA
jgi:uncharacterized protein (UPF0276 family)